LPDWRCVSSSFAWGGETYWTSLIKLLGKPAVALHLSPRVCTIGLLNLLAADYLMETVQVRQRVSHLGARKLKHVKFSVSVQI
jgi:hypothetical protein